MPVDPPCICFACDDESREELSTFLHATCCFFFLFSPGWSCRPVKERCLSRKGGLNEAHLWFGLR